MRYLLDTNIWIVYLKSRKSKVSDRLRATPTQALMTCSVVWSELLHGATKYDDPVERRCKVEETLIPLRNYDFDVAAAYEYARIRDHLERRGNLIGGNDLMIAAIALAHDLTVVTNNTGEFNRVPGLRVEDWSV